MSMGDKISNAKEKLEGQAKELFGKATDDEAIQSKGKSDQAGADLKQGGEKIKDAFNNATK